MTMAACTSTARLTCLSVSSTASHRAAHRGATRGHAPRRFEGAHRASRFSSSSSSSSRLRAANDGDDDGYYESWAKYPDDQGVPPEIAEMLREVGDGEPDMWKTKPPWCQPWTILLTGTVITAAPEVVFGWKWLSALVAVPIAAWWYVFLVVVPKQFKEYVESARGYYPKRE